MAELKQAENIVSIEGILSEANIAEGVSKKTGKDYIMGDVKIRTSATINGVETELEIPVKLFSNKLKKDGKPNPAYDSIKKIQDMVSLASCGGELEKADYIRFDSANIQMNEYYGRDDQLKSYPTIRGTFSRKINRTTFTPAAEFSCVIVVGNITEETDKNGDLTGRLKIKGILPQFGGKVDVVDFIVASESAIKHIQTYWQKGDTVRIAGVVNFTSRTEDEIVEMGFGEPEVKHHTVSVSELLITKGSQGALDAEFAYDSNDISAALNERQARLAELKNNSAKKTAVAAKGSTIDLGF